MIREKIKQIVANIDKFEPEGNIRWTYKNISIFICSYSAALEVNGEEIELLKEEKEILFDTLKDKQQERNLKRERDKKRLLNAITFKEK
jgi:hypothetical protein